MDLYDSTKLYSTSQLLFNIFQSFSQLNFYSKLMSPTIYILKCMTQSNHLKLFPLYGTFVNIIFGDIVLYFSAPMTVQTSGYQSKISCPKNTHQETTHISSFRAPQKENQIIDLRENISTCLPYFKP